MIGKLTAGSCPTDDTVTVPGGQSCTSASIPITLFARLSARSGISALHSYLVNTENFLLLQDTFSFHLLVTEPLYISNPVCGRLCLQAFSKKKVDERKEWLTNWMEERKRRTQLGLPELYLYGKETKHITYNEFINRELILFSNADNERSIPSLVDGKFNHILGVSLIRKIFRYDYWKKNLPIPIFSDTIFQLDF